MYENRIDAPDSPASWGVRNTPSPLVTRPFIIAGQNVVHSPQTWQTIPKPGENAIKTL